MKVLCIFGTRPDAIKMAPVVEALQGHPRFRVFTCATGQHRGMLDQALRAFSLHPDYDLNLMSHNQTLAAVTGTAITGVERIIRRVQPDWVLVQGDTTTSMAAAMAAYYHQTPVGHVEAGLRTHNIYSPWPEEVNRKCITSISLLHFAPTQTARRNLLREGVPPNRVFVTGNTVIDALLKTHRAIQSSEELQSLLRRRFHYLTKSRHVILVTGHRRENWGMPLASICNALISLAKESKLQIVYPVHLNPNVRRTVLKRLAGFNNIRLIEPVDYVSFVYLMGRAHLILTDSGGIQEEAPALGKPVLIMRDTTERPEALQVGAARLVGTRATDIVAAVTDLLEHPRKHLRMSKQRSTFGDGEASKRIAGILCRYRDNVATSR